MYLPKIYENFSSKFPEVLKDFKKLGQTCRAVEQRLKSFSNVKTQKIPDVSASIQGEPATLVSQIFRNFA